MSVRHAVPQDNPFVTAPVGRLFLSNARPMADGGLTLFARQIGCAPPQTWNVSGVEDAA